MSNFPKPHNDAKPIIENDKITFSYLNSYGKAVTETKSLLNPNQVANRVVARHERFGKAKPGSRESELSRAERKYISAHSESILRSSFDLLDDDGKMEFSMMFDPDSHFGISDPKWLKDNASEHEAVIGDDGKELNMPVKSSKQYRFMQMMAHTPSRKKTKGVGPSPEVAREMIAKTSKKKRSQYARGG